MNRESRLPEFIRHLELSRSIHEKKNEDYATAADPLQNFSRSATIAGWFENPQDIAYTVLIGTKLARLANLLSNPAIVLGHRRPNNESIDDTFLDLLTYVNLWWCDYDRRTPIGIEAASSEISHGEARGAEQSSQQEGRRDRGITYEDMELARRITETLKGFHISDREEATDAAFTRIVLTIQQVRREQNRDKSEGE